MLHNEKPPQQEARALQQRVPPLATTREKPPRSNEDPAQPKKKLIHKEPVKFI